jgi:hypothetical protein
MSDPAVYRLDATTHSFERAVQAVSEAIVEARVAGHGQILVLVPEVSFPAPSLSARHQMARAWAEAADGRLALAVVCPAQLIDPEKFGVIAARNFGLLSNVFSNEAEARAWLAAQPDTGDGFGAAPIASTG